MRTLGIAPFCLLLGCATSGAPLTPAPASSAIPDAIKVPPGQTLALDARASGVQIYECAPKADDPSKFDWIFRAPEADLTDGSGKPIGKHYAGPTWESTDGSKVVGQLKARDPGPDPNSIPWLLLEAKSASGDGVLGKTTAIQRIDTVGGKAPAEPCSQYDAGKMARVPYTARYLFYRGP